MMGYPATQVLNFIGTKIPHLAEGIQSAKNQGFDADKILNFLANKVKKGNTKQVQSQANSQDRYLSSVGIKTRAERDESEGKFLQGALGVGAGAVGLMGLSRALPVAGQIGQQIAQNIGFTGSNPSASPSNAQATAQPPSPSSTIQTPGAQQLSSSLLQAPMANGAGTNPPQQPNHPIQANSSQPPVSSSITQTPNIVNLNALKAFKKTALARLVDGMKKQIQDPNDLAAGVRKLYGTDASSFEKANKTSLEDIITEYLKEPPESPPSSSPPPSNPEPPISPQPQPSLGGSSKEIPIEEIEPLQTATALMEEPKNEMELPEQLEDKSFDEFKKAVLPKKRDLVASSEGIGEIKEINDKNALIDIGGKVKQVPIDQLETEPEEIKKIDFQDMAKKYISAIPEKDRSTAMLINFFQPTGKDQKGQEIGQFFVVFPSDPGHIGIYDNVPIELVNKINSASTEAKTSGKTTLGEHEAGRADSRYAAATILKKNSDLYPYKKVSIPYNLAQPLFEANRLNEVERRKAESEDKKKKKQEENAKKLTKKRIKT